jgi:hypothetical protein
MNIEAALEEIRTNCMTKAVSDRSVAVAIKNALRAEGWQVCVRSRPAGYTVEPDAASNYTLTQK